MGVFLDLKSTSTIDLRHSAGPDAGEDLESLQAKSRRSVIPATEV
jgi:hypothetical protein